MISVFSSLKASQAEAAILKRHGLRASSCSCSRQRRQKAWFKSGNKMIKRLVINVGVGVGLSLALVGPAIAIAIAEQSPSPFMLEFTEPSNALSLPTWAVHVSSVAEWIIAMLLVWQYGDRPGNQSWKGLTWGMVPLLGGAMCACTWHFFYNSETLEVLVALQAALTFFGNATLCIAAYRIYKSQNQSGKI